MGPNIGSNGLPSRALGASSGSHTFLARWRSGGIIRLETRCGTITHTREIRYPAIEVPRLNSLSPSRASEGDRLTIRGQNLGSSGEAQLVIGEARMTMRVYSWTDSAIEASVPTRAPSGSGYIHVFKGRGRLQSNSINFRVIRLLVIDRGLLQFVHDLLGMSNIQLRLDDGGGSLRFPAEMRRWGAVDRTFTIPRLEVNVSAGAQIAEGALSPVKVEKLRYVINDINLASVNLAVAGGQIVVTIGFESGGTEVKGKAQICASIPPFGAAGACLDRSWDDSLAPDAEADNATVTLRFTPAARDGAIRLSSASAAFDADFRVHNRLADWAARQLADYERRVEAEVSSNLNTSLASFQDTISQALMERFRRDIGAARILAVTPSASGNSIRVEYE
jgi:hypothetical protein